MGCLAPFLLGFVRLGLGSGQADNIWEDTCKGPLYQDRFTVAQKSPCGTERSLAHTSRFPWPLQGPPAGTAQGKAALCALCAGRCSQELPIPQRGGGKRESCVHTLLPAHPKAQALALSPAVTLSRRGAEGRLWSEWRENNSGISLQQRVCPPRTGSASAPTQHQGPSGPRGAPREVLAKSFMSALGNRRAPWHSGRIKAAEARCVSSAVCVTAAWSCQLYHQSLP